MTYKDTDPALQAAWQAVRDNYARRANGLPPTLNSKVKEACPDLFLVYLAQAGLPLPVREWRICAARQWRADYAWPANGLILEVQGGFWGARGWHKDAIGAANDHDKFNAAAILGVRLLQVMPGRLISPQTIMLLRQALGIDEADIGALYPQATIKKARKPKQAAKAAKRPKQPAAQLPYPVSV